MPVSRRLFTAAAALMAGGSTFAQPGGDKPVRIILPYPPGSGLDVVGRYLSGELKQPWEQQPVIDNKPGASGILALTEFKRAAPDGQTLLIATNDQLVGNRLVYKSLPYDADQDVTVISGIYYATFCMSAGVASGITSVRDLIAQAKAKPGKIAYATLGKGTLGHLSAENFAAQAGISMLHVPFRDLGTLATSVGSGDVDLVFLPLSSVDPLRKAGKLQALASLSPARQPLYPQVPTLEEAGGGSMLHVRGWVTLAAPKGTPKALMDRMEADVLKIVRDDRYRQRVGEIGGYPFPATRTELQGLVEQELTYYRVVASRPGMQLD